MQSISPEIIFRGNDAWKEALPQITKLSKRPKLSALNPLVPEKMFEGA